MIFPKVIGKVRHNTNLWKGELYITLTIQRKVDSLWNAGRPFSPGTSSAFGFLQLIWWAMNTICNPTGRRLADEWSLGRCRHDLLIQGGIYSPLLQPKSWSPQPVLWTLTPCENVLPSPLAKHTTAQCWWPPAQQTIFVYFLAALGIKLMALHLLDKCSITWATSQAFLLSGYFSDRVLYFLPRLTLHQNLPTMPPA
jgi:hypothetical protein